MKTLDEVIAYFDNQTQQRHVYLTEDAEDIYNDVVHYLKEYRTTQTAYIKAMADLEENPPLTWDELRQMVGKPVWIDSVPQIRRWVIIKKFLPVGGNKNLFEMEVQDGGHFFRKNMKRCDPAWWQAYRKERE